MKSGFEKFKETWSRQVVGNRKLPGSAIRVAWAISFHMNRYKSGEAWPGIAKLASLTALSERQVYRAIGQLERAGHVHVTRCPGGVNHYMPILMDAEPSLKCHPTPDREVSPPLTGKSPKPLIEPLSEPLPYGLDYIEAEKKGVGEEGKIFGLARSHYGERGASLVAQALKDVATWGPLFIRYRYLP
jgi:hypothetical protein